MQAMPATEHVEVSVEQQKKNIKERLEENRQEVKKSTVFVFLREKRRIGLLFTKPVLMHWHI